MAALAQQTLHLPASGPTADLESGPVPRPRAHLRLVPADGVVLVRSSRPGSALMPSRRVVYLRRQAAVVAALAVLLLITITTIRTMQASAAPLVSPAAAQLLDDSGAYTVRPGDTMWSIAARLTEGDPRPLIHGLVELNGSEPLEAGDVLAVPRG